MKGLLYESLCTNRYYGNSNVLEGFFGKGILTPNLLIIRADFDFFIYSEFRAR